MKGTAVLNLPNRSLNIILRAYQGDRVVYIGEWGDACGDEAMVTILGDHWAEVAYDTPVQWMGLHDGIYVLDRKV